MAEEVCCICGDDMPSDGGQTVTLSCGHSFHGTCAVQWFRYNHTSCPLCRADDLHEAWAPVTKERRLHMMRQRYESLPSEVRRQLRQLEISRRAERTVHERMRTHEREHREVFKDARRLRRLADATRARIARVEAYLAVARVPGVPTLSPTESE